MSDPNPRRLSIPKGTQQKLDAFRKRVWTIKVIEGVCAAAFGLVLAYLLVFAVDRFIDTPSWMRALLLLGGAAGLGIGFPLKLHRWVWNTRRFDQVARLLKHRMPQLADRMLGIIELSENDVEQQRSATLVNAALQQVDEDIKDKSFDDAVPNPRHRTWAWVAGIPCAVALLGLLLVPSASLNAMKRWLTPWGNTERYTFAQLDSLPERLVVPYSEDFSLTANIADDSPWSPNKALAQIGKQPVVEANREQNQYVFDLPPQKEDGLIKLKVGDAAKSIPVEPKLRPELTELLADIKLPAYLGYTSDITKDARSGSISVVRGSTTTLHAKASRELAMASLNGQTQQVQLTSIQTTGTTINESSSLELTWADEYGLTAKEPFQLEIQANDDLPPNVTCSELKRQQVVMVDQVLTFAVSADDDFGVKEIGIQWQGLEDPLTNPNPAKGETVILSGEPESSELTVTAAFSAAREGISPQTLQIRLYSVDFMPGRERVYSQPYTLFVLSQQDHANWLTEQLRRWSRQAQAVYERENQLYEENKALRALPAEELATKETRDRIESQAVAETANGRMLGSISAQGKQLIREASKNDQFNVMTMEGLAEMVKTLDELAKNRMPSVADLLKTAAQAKTNEAAKPSESSKSDQQEQAPQVGNNRDPNNQSGKSDDGEDDGKKQKPVPSISDIESSMNRPDDEDDEDDSGEKKKSPSGAPKFGLPTTTILGGGVKQKKKASQEESEMEEKLDEAIEEQEDLLDQFSKIAEELQRILDNLEGSTFVKRLKAASRRQTEIADELNNSLAEKFGRRPSQLSEQERTSTVAVAEREVAEGDNLATIKTDLEAYYSRVQQGKFRTVIAEMETMRVTPCLQNLSNLVESNLHGQSIAHAEFWADTFDRWAEQLVGPG